jgi:hypothetical protein
MWNLIWILPVFLTSWAIVHGETRKEIPNPMSPNGGNTNECERQTVPADLSEEG